MASLFEIGKSAVNAQRQALNVTGQNIANVNTDGYRKRDASLKEVSGSQSELTSIAAQVGLGVSLGTVRRAYNSFLASSTNMAESRFQSATEFSAAMERLENLILPGEGDLSQQLSDFFSKMSDIAANPGDLAPRAAALEQGNSLANAFNVTAQVLSDLEYQFAGTIDQEADEVNRLIDSLGVVNGRLRSSNIGAAPPNALLDERDRLITEISKRVRITTTFGPRYDVDVRLGSHASGPQILEGETSYTLKPIHSETDGVVYRLGAKTIVKSLDDGSMKGLSNALLVIQGTQTQLDALSNRFISEINAAHTSGIDFDGELGKELFTARAFRLEQAKTNSQPLDINILEVPGKIDQVPNATFRYSAATASWNAYDLNNKLLASGRSQIDLGGVIIQVDTRAREGDSFAMQATSGEASRMQFLLKNGREIAAASNFIVTPNSANTGSSVLVAKPQEMKPLNLEPMVDLTINSISPVSYTEFLKGGAVGYIPAGTDTFQLASFGQDSVVNLNFNSIEGLSGFEFTLGGNTYSFPESAQSDVVGRLSDTQQLAEYLNAGTLTASRTGASGSGTGISLNDLGLFASGFDGGIKIVGQAEFTSGAVTVTSGSSADTTAATITQKEAASGFRVFTREGRQISGLPLSSGEANSFITEENGFDRNASYRADYLNAIGGVGYRGAQINNLIPGGYAAIETAASQLMANDPTKLVAQNPALNGMLAQTLKFETTDGLMTQDVALQSGLSMKSVAAAVNTGLAQYGIVADAKTMASLELASSAAASGTVSFSLVTPDSTEIGFSATYQSSDLSPLVTQINQRQAQTGISAEVSADGTRLILTQAEGLDISLTNASGSALEVNSLDHNYNKLLTSDVALNQSTKVIGSLSFQSPRGFKVTSSNGQVQSSGNLATRGGGASKTFAQAGTITDYAIKIAPEHLAPQASPNGMRLNASNTTFKLSVPVNNGATLAKELKSKDLEDYSIASISKQLVAMVREDAVKPTLNGAAISQKPADGSSMSVKVGSSTYTVTYTGGEMVVSGPEQQRLIASLAENSGSPTTYTVSLSAPGGVMSGHSIEVLNDTDAAEFGLATTSSGAMALLQGKDFSLADGASESFSVLVGSTTVTVTASRSGANYTFSSNNAKLKFVSPVDGAVTTGPLTFDSSANTPLLSLTAALSDGGIKVVPSADAAKLGIQATDLDFEVNDTGFRAISTGNDPANVSLEIDDLPGQVLSMSGLPDEDFIILLEESGAKRLASSYDMPSAEANQAREEFKEFRVKVIDANLGKIELFDHLTGDSIATRYSSGVAEFEVDNFRFELAGFGDDGDYFDVSLNRSNAGDGRNMEAMIDLATRTPDRPSFQDDFRAIALAVGSQLESARLIEKSATSLRDAAVATEDELSGVNLDEEAGKLLEQQQAYKAAAQILQSAREMFDTLVNIM